MEQFEPVSQLVEMNQIRELMARYARLADEKRFDDLSELFTADGTFTTKKVSGEISKHLAGRTEIARSISASVADAVAIHHLFSYETNFTSRFEAHTIVAMEDRLIYPESAASEKRGFRRMHGFGHYHVDLVKEHESWRIRKLVQTRTILEFKN